MHRYLAVALTVVLLLAGGLSPIAAPTARAATTVRVSINDPRDGETISEPRDVIFVGGHAYARGEEAPAFDIAILIDTSGSTSKSSGVDVNGNGIVGLTSRPTAVISVFGVRIEATADPGDSILAAEVLAARKLISQLNPRTTRVALVSFAGDYLPGTGKGGNRTYLANPATPDAYLEQPLTNNFRLARVALGQVERGGPYGGTNIAEGIRVAIKELTGLSGSGSVPRRDAHKVILLLTDGFPTFPVGSHRMDPGDVKLAVEAAEVAGRFGIRAHTFALGREALSEPFTVKEVARVTGGRFTPVPDPADIITVLPGINLIDLYRVEVVNVTTGQRALRVKSGPDGSFRALVPVQNGLNKISAVARATDGAQDQAEVNITFIKLPSEERRNLELARQSELDLDLEKAETDRLQLELDKLKKENLERGIEQARRDGQHLKAELGRLRDQLAREAEERRRQAEEAKLTSQREAALQAIEEAERREIQKWNDEERRRREQLELDLTVKDKGGTSK
ncbi:MAG: VWA domain-containing protein [Nitrospinae bacterium]|nr:VWA domain-containing protein [Nitrospinota bacterium]